MSDTLTPMFRVVATTTPQQLARIVVQGLYEIGGALDDVQWDVGSPPSITSPTLAAETTARVYLRKDAQVYAARAPAAAADTTVVLTLLWPDE